MYTCTSSAFDGLVSLMQPKDSWVAKWQNIQRKVPGVYAISVSGTLPGNVQVWVFSCKFLLFVSIVY